MTIEIGYFFRDVCGATSNSWAGKLFTNVLYTALLISVIVLLIICFAYPAKRNTPIYVTFRLIFYVYVAVLAVLAIQHRIVEINLEDKYGSQINKDVVGAIRGGAELFGDGKHVNIKPNYKAKSEGKELEEEDVGGGDEDPETVLNYVLSKENNKHTEQRYGGAESNVKVAGASVEDMLRELGV
jgi:hypothetical protein